MDLKTCTTGLYRTAHPVLNPTRDKRMRPRHWLGCESFRAGTSVRVEVMNREEYARYHDLSDEDMARSKIARRVTLKLPGSYSDGSEEVVIRVMQDGTIDIPKGDDKQQLAKYVAAIVESLEERTDARGQLARHHNTDRFDYEEVLLKLMNDGIVSLDHVLNARRELAEEWEREEEHGPKEEPDAPEEGATS